MLRITASLTPVTNSWREASRFVSILKRFRRYLRPHRNAMIISTLASLGYTAVTLLEPWPIQVVFDGVLLGQPVRLLGVDLRALAGDRPLVLLAGASLAVLALAALRGQFYFTQNVRSATSGQDVVMSIRRQLFRHLQSLSISFHRKAHSGDLFMRLTGDIVMLREMVVAAVITLLTQGLVVVGTLVIMLTINVRLTMIALLVVPFLFLVLSAFRIQLAEAASRQRRREGRLASTVHEVLTSVQIVQAYTAEQHEDARFREMNKRSLRAGVRLTRIEAQLNRAVQIAVAVGVCAILWFGTQDVTARRLSPGQLLVFLAYLRGLYRPLRQASKLTQRMAKAAACGHRVLEVLDEEPQIQDPPKAVSLRRVRGQITFRDVSFSYRPGEPVLRNVSLEISPHEMVAVVGPTGAGKSTLLSLIPRFYDPQGGQMLIDGTPIATVRLQSLRRHISFLPQEALVMGISIRENIAYGAIGRRGAPPDENEIERAARKAHAHEFIVDLPNGYDTVVGERGATLSGGQRQRIAIARAIVRRAPILLMDEPMAGLDPVSATAVLEALDEVTPKRTALVVAHHLSTVLHATRVVFLDDGEIVEQGTHDNLLARGGRYAEFFHTEWSNMAARVDDTAWAVPPDPSAKR